MRVCSIQPALLLLLASLAQPVLHAQQTGKTAHSTAQPQDTMRPADQALFDHATQQYDAGEAIQAVPVLTELAQRYPRNVQAQSAAGMCLLEAGDATRGVPFLERSLHLYAADAPIRRNLALAYVQLERWPQALALLEPITAADAHDFEAWFALGQALRAHTGPAQAVPAYEHAASIATPANAATLPDLLYDWAEALLAAGQPKAAAAVLAHLPEPVTDAQTLELRADIREHTADYEAAVSDYRKAAEAKPSEAYLAAYGEELLKHWTFMPAEQIFTYGRQRFPQSVRLERDLGIAYFGGNDYVRAGDIFGAMLAANPDDASLADLLGRSCDALANASSAACVQLPAFAAAHPHNAPAALYAAIALQQQLASDDTYARTQTLLESALHNDPRLAQAWYQLGVLEQARSEWAASASSLEHAIALRPAYAEAHYRLSRAYAHLGRAADAKAQMDQQRDAAAAAKQAETERLQGVLTFLTAAQ